MLFRSSPVGLRAWEVERGHVSIASVISVSKENPVNRIPGPASSSAHGTNKTAAVSDIESKIVRGVMTDLLDARRNLGLDSGIQDIAQRIAAILRISQSIAERMVRNTAPSLGYRIDNRNGVDALIKVNLGAGQLPQRVHSSLAAW